MFELIKNSCFKIKTGSMFKYFLLFGLFFFIIPAIIGITFAYIISPNDPMGLDIFLTVLILFLLHLPSALLGFLFNNFIDNFINYTYLILAIYALFCDIPLLFNEKKRQKYFSYFFIFRILFVFYLFLNIIFGIVYLIL